MAANFFLFLEVLLKVITAILIALSPLGTLELFNHLKGGDTYRSWFLDDELLMKMKRDEERLQECGFVERQARILDMPMTEESSSSTKFKIKGK